jgi:hypothetical protein
MEIHNFRNMNTSLLIIDYLPKIMFWNMDILHTEIAYVELKTTRVVGNEQLFEIEYYSVAYVSEFSH